MHWKTEESDSRFLLLENNDGYGKLVSQRILNKLVTKKLTELDVDVVFVAGSLAILLESRLARASLVAVVGVRVDARRVGFVAHLAALAVVHAAVVVGVRGWIVATDISLGK